jgi:hypothetical protein
MAILNKLTWIDSAALTRFILSAQVRERTIGLFRCVYIVLPFIRTPRVEELRTGRVT